ncbi:MAG: endoglucanase [Candidatus Infernicultor aquiphilus]|uniref:Endoglucanase n=1 Tax=Candidatus Infernicultor aquiphilus TaxID=1805029 RepID=A0A1J5GIV9_9BACT|nr:M42 family metallopeptidase [bacterium]OIP72203.1 MAG: endoglucanase [Candidatus Atribacteria bacterium CG2_30_33_13]PIU24815.1 MAG: endoglucanase [Candidatus Atribacteria bacterium CG08_land_8_20_14_0_20_33_29]PIW11705.1 MAG: endoglucanase [Candidatus Atribacteria bacterium CG17_big_fil_post_rev_8_21_14_2_50_34_11]PIX33908.1 MAG: endoglucanase [Candidatus Atribacteria bacterium CG_4_8_14_3_um_filter_34_18]PIY33507.1 MAG: endoglucanase [Candidatus Atribacteria bacterium CG_4_10_14_3_um_filt
MELLKKLCETPGISGYEERIQKVIKEELGKVTDEVKIDKLGNIIGIKKTKKAMSNSLPKKVMLAAHMDEIGFMISFIDKDGFLRFAPVGGFDPRTLIAQRVVVHGVKDIGGVIGSKPIHILEEEEKKKATKIKDLFIDVGLKKEEVSKIVKPGDFVTLDRDFKELNNKIITAKALDDRVGVYVMIEALKRIKSCYVDIYAVATVQEEVGLRGATVSSFSVEPDLGIALDVTIASDLPGTKEEEMVTNLGGGTAISLMDSHTISNKKLVDFLRKIAEENKIKYQTDILLGGGTDAGAIQRSKSGVPACTISIPTRYVHSVVEMCHKEDIESSIKLICKFLENAHQGEF